MSQQSAAALSPTAAKVVPSEIALVADMIQRARRAMAVLADASQTRVDEAVTALAWSIYREDHAQELAELAVADTGLGNVPDKVRKNQRKTFGTLRDLLRARTVGVIEELPEKGLVKYAKPVGVVGAVCPSTNPAATTVNKAMMALKGANAVVIAPSPAGSGTTRRTCDLMRAELKKIGLPEDLVQCLPDPVTKEMTQALLELSDLAVVTGSQDNVRRAYRSGTPAIGVGAGNVPVIIDTSADLDQAARLICQSKTFDNATSCSAENALVIVDAVYDRAIAALQRAGGFMASAAEKKQIQDVLWAGGRLNRHVIAKDADVFARACGLPQAALACKFFMVEEGGVGKAYPFSGEKLSLALAVYRARDIDAAILRVQEILNYQGMGHSCGIHTRDLATPRRIAERLNVVRVLVNQAHCVGNGGSFDNGLGFTLTMGCGTWAKNSISENLSYQHFINITHLSTVIPEDLPSEEALFGAHWSRYGH
ncbi:MAG: aldehyde dehydrogenase family protein [Alphaproteobacteria bacterium]|nr:aldehyde dehydrogenase family protein [Alphaproteobacteria bacterium]